MRALAVGVLLAVTLLPAAAQPPASAVLSRLVWFDRGGQRLAGVGPIADHGNLELSPDGTRVAVAVRDARTATFDIWIHDLAADERRRFAADASDENWMIWSPDGARVLLNSFSATGLFLFESPASGITTRTPLVSVPNGAWPVSWSRDGRFVLYVTNSADTGNDVWVLPRDDRTPPYPFLQTRSSENWAAFSPDGRRVAFSATDSGHPEVYVSPFPADGRRWQISAGGGSQARWRRDGNEIFYLGPDGMLVAAGVADTGDGLRVTSQDALFRLSAPYGAYHAFDVSADGRRILVNTLLTDPTRSGTIARRAPTGLNTFPRIAYACPTASPWCASRGQNPERPKE
jgi:Tol biopolymer transport system component